MSKHRLTVYYDPDATPRDRSLWGAMRKLYQLSDGKMAYREIFNAFELIALEEKLLQEGWSRLGLDEEDEDYWVDEDSSMGKRHVVTYWVKDTEGES